MGDALDSLFRKSGVKPDRLSILHSVWDKEMGHYARHWLLSGVRGSTLYVRPVSSAAAQELHMRSREIVRNLNKYFSRPWIRALKIAAR